jgi:uncharacterized protein YidB (DUF937 family)
VTSKTARANVTPVRQRTQFSCMAASMSMALKALQIHCTEDEAADVMGVRPMRGATWEDALAAAQHFGCRGTLVVPATLAQLKEWTDAGDPVLIAWNPEGREWSHASVVFDVDDEGNVSVADPNIPNPEETVRVMAKNDFYARWAEKWPRYMVRRPALRLSREITPEGRQVMASQKRADQADRFNLMNTLRQQVHAELLVQLVVKYLTEAQAESLFATLADLHHYPIAAREDRFAMLAEALTFMRVDTLLDELAREMPDEIANKVLTDIVQERRIILGSDTVSKKARFEEGKKMSVEDVADYLREGGNPEAADDWIKYHAQNKDKFTEEAKGKKAAVQPKVHAVQAYHYYGILPLKEAIKVMPSAVEGEVPDQKNPFDKGKKATAQAKGLKLADFAEQLHTAAKYDAYHMETLQTNLNRAKATYQEEPTPGNKAQVAKCQQQLDAGLAKQKKPRKARFEEGKKMSVEEVAEYLRNGGNPEAADDWIKFHEKNKDKFTDEAKGKKARFEEGKKMPVEEVAEYLRNGGNPEAADDWIKFHEKNKDKFTDEAKSKKAGYLPVDKNDQVSRYLKLDPTEYDSVSDDDELWTDETEDEASADISVQDFEQQLRLAQKSAKFEEGKSVDVPKYLRDHDNPQGAEDWKEENEKNKDNFKKASIRFEELEKAFPELLEEELETLVQYMHGGPNKLVLINKLVKGHGVETVKSSEGDAVALFVELGDMYSRTALYDVENRDLKLISVADWREGYEREHEVDENTDKYAKVQKKAVNHNAQWLLRVFKDIDKEDAARLAQALKSKGRSAIDKALVIANDVLDGNGIETLTSEDAWDNYYGDTIALYVNLGDMYHTTVLYSIEEEDFIVDAPGDWIEAYENQGGRVKGANLSKKGAL